MLAPRLAEPFWEPRGSQNGWRTTRTALTEAAVPAIEARDMKRGDPAATNLPRGASCQHHQKKRVRASTVFVLRFQMTFAPSAGIGTGSRGCLNAQPSGFGRRIRLGSIATSDSVGR